MLRAVSEQILGLSPAVLASTDEQSVPVFQQLARGHPFGRDDVREIPAVTGNVEDLLAERGIDVSYETVRFWWNRFGPIFCRRDPQETCPAHAQLSSVAVALG